MKYILFFIMSSSLFAQNVDCLKYEQKIFDSDTCCWRKLTIEREFERGAHLIVAFLEKGKVQNKLSLNWHAGQLFACAENDKLALKYMGRTYSAFQKWFGGEDGKTWFYFVKGNMAFIERNKPKLERIIKHWKVRFPKDNNYKELLRLLNNWDMSFEKATSSSGS